MITEEGTPRFIRAGRQDAGITALIRTRSRARWLSVLAGVAALWAALAVAPLWGQAPPASAQEEQNPPGEMRRVRPRRLRAQRRHGPGFFARLRELPPEEQERVMANDERFQRLPPERQERIRENLRRWNALTPAQQEILRQRQEIFESLSPAQRRQARAVFPEWRRLAPERRQAVLAAFRRLRSLSPDQRQDYLSSPEVEQQFSPEERRVLAGLSQLLPGSRLDSRPEPEEPQE